MSTNFPTGLTTYTNPSPTDEVGVAVGGRTHSQFHSDNNDDIESLQAKVGIDGSAVTTSHDYKLSEVTGTDKAVGKTATQTLTNKTLTSPTINTPSISSPVSTGTDTGTQTLTNKTINGNNNTLTVLAGSQLSGATPIANGGTGQTTQTEGFDALAPTTTKGDIIAHNGTDNIRLPVGSNNLTLIADSTQASGMKWAAPTSVITGAFGGNGSDGALTVTSGTTSIDLGGIAFVVKNYTSISITGTGAVNFTNAHANGSVVILKSQGDVTLTSSAAPMLDASGIGGAGGAGATRSSGSGNDFGNNGSTGVALQLTTDYGDGNGAPPAGGTKPSAYQFSATYVTRELLKWKYPNISIGAGGGGGQAIRGLGTATATGGTGGNGGGGVVIECAGAWNFTTASGISVAGDNGTDGSGTGAGDYGGGGGGGGGGGSFMAIYKTLTANSGTITVSGGTGGLTVENYVSNPYGGGGGSSGITNGSNGASAANGVQSGGNGGTGQSIVIADTEFV